MPFGEDSYHLETSQLIYKSNQIDLLASMWCGISLMNVSEQSVGLSNICIFIYKL